VTLNLPEEIADSVFEVLEEIMRRAKDAGDDAVAIYVGPIFLAYGQALAKAKPKRRSKILPRPKR
jgi:diacylglycerol kinase